MATEFRRVVTGHDSRGLAVIKSDDSLSLSPIDSADAHFRDVWVTPDVPVDLNAGTDGEFPSGKTLNGGSVIRRVDMLPGKKSPMHRSFSIDYGIILEGRLELILDGGAVVQLAAGDIVIQRGTNHLWHNPSTDTVCKIVFILIEAAPIAVDDRLLPEIHP